MALNLQDIMRMIAPPTDGLGNVSDSEVANFREKMLRNKLDEMRRLRSSGLGQVSDAEAAVMSANPALSLPAAGNMPNYANNEMPLYTGGLLENPQGQMVDPQMLMNTAYDMSAPREMRINAIERLRALGVI